MLVALLASACQVSSAPPAARTNAAPSPAATPSLAPVGLTATEVQPPKALWSFQTDGAIWGPPAVANGAVYIGSDDRNLYAVDVQTGKLKWKFAAQGLVR